MTEIRHGEPTSETTRSSPEQRFQWQPSLKREDWPAWARDPYRPIGEFRLFGQTEPHHLAVYGRDDRPQIVKPGDWLVRDAEGDIRVESGL